MMGLCTLNPAPASLTIMQDRHVKAKAAGALQSLAVDEENQRKIKSLGAIPLITKVGEIYNVYLMCDWGPCNVYLMCDWGPCDWSPHQ